MTILTYQAVRRTLFESVTLRIGHVVVRPVGQGWGNVERQQQNVVVLPLNGVFAKHDGPKRETLGTPNHAVFIAAGSPYRLSFPGGIGDECLTLWLPEDTPADFESQSLLSPAALLGRSVLWQRLRNGERDSLETEELGVALLDALRKREGRERSLRQARRVARVQEAVAVDPARKWTLATLAALAGSSPYHLARVFREEVGSTIHRYVTRARLAKALQRVLERDADFAAVAVDTGFASHSHFTARFRREFGLTPSEVRRASSKTIRELRKILTARAPAWA